MKLSYLILGIISCSTSLFFFIIYLNLFTVGYTFLNFVNFSIRRIWFWLFPIGLFMIYKGMERKIKNELLLRHQAKFFRR